MYTVEAKYENRLGVGSFTGWIVVNDRGLELDAYPYTDKGKADALASARRLTGPAYAATRYAKV